MSCRSRISSSSSSRLATIDAHLSSNSFESCPFSYLLLVAFHSLRARHRLANLIGSLHFWEPPYLIVVYDIGLSPASKKLVASWHNVVVKKMEVAGNGLPDHFALPPLVAYKSWVIEDAMRNFGVEGGVIMWLDANTEVRRR